MSNSCSIMATVTFPNSNRPAEESKLFKSLLSFVKSNVKGESDRDLAVALYERFKNTDYIRKNFKSIGFNNQDQAKFGDLLRETNLSNVVPQSRIDNYINKWFPEKISRDTTENYTQLVDKVIDFNKNSELSGGYVATINPFIKDNQRYLSVSVEPYNEENSEKASSLANAKILNDKIRTILKNNNVSIEAYNELNKELQYDGAIEFKAAIDAANGLSTIVKLAQGSIGEAALSEEFSHFIVNAMYTSPLMQRIRNFVSSNGLEKAILGNKLEEYNGAYEADAEGLLFEAVSKLVEASILQDSNVNNTALDKLLERLKNAFKEKFSQLSATEIDNLISEVTLGIKKISREALENTEKISRECYNLVGEFYKLAESVSSDTKMLQKILENSIKRADLYKLDDVSKDSEYYKAESEYLHALEQFLDSEEPKHKIFGMYTFVARAINQFNGMAIKLEKIAKEKHNLSIREVSAQLIQAKDYIKSYSGMLEDLAQYVATSEEEEDYFEVPLNDGTTTHLKDSINTALGLSRRLNMAYEALAKPTFLAFIKPFLGENIEVPFDGAVLGLKKGDKVSVDYFVNNPVHDISFLDRWLNSMANSSDWMNKLFDQAVKDAKNKARLETIDWETKLKAAGKMLENAGIRDQSFVFERDDKGNLTLNFVSAINYGEYERRKKEFIDSLDKQLPEDSNTWTKEQTEKRSAAIKNWLNNNSEWNEDLGKYIPLDYFKKPDGTKDMSRPAYRNFAYDSIMNNSAKKAFYETMLDMKKEFDSYLPIDGSNTTKVPVIMNDIIQRVKNAGNLKEGVLALWESAKDSVVRRSDDVGYGMDNGEGYTKKKFRIVKVNFDGKPIDKLPIHYQKLRKDVYDDKGKLIQKGENANDVSTDLVSTMTAYADMACRYREMRKIVDTLNIGRDWLDRNQQVALTEGGTPVVDLINHGTRTFEHQVMKQGDSRIKQQRDDFFSAQVYERYFENEGTIKILGQQVDIAKLANTLNNITAINGLALNVLNGFANVEQGVIMMDIEAKAREFLTTEDTIGADADYIAWMTDFVPEIGSRIKSSNFWLFSQKFNVLQEYDREVLDTKFNRNRWFANMFGENILFFINNAGEHWMQHRTFFAMNRSKKEQLTDSKGNKIKPTQAFYKLYLQKDGSYGKNDAGLGAKLFMLEGIKDPKGRTIITVEQQKKGVKIGKGEISEQTYVKYFSKKVSEINHRLHGIFNTEDMNAFQRTAVGRMAMMYRKWIVPSIERRYRKVDYNIDLESWTEGYYNTAKRVIWQMIKDVKDAQFNLATFKENLSDMEKANIRRALTEMGHFAAICSAIVLLDWDDETDSPWAIEMLKYQLYRMRTEVGSLVPNIRMPREALKLLQSPSADINTAQTILDTLTLLNPFSYSQDEDDLIRSGRFKGHTKAYKTFMTSIIMPFNNDFYAVTHPEEKIPFFKQ